MAKSAQDLDDILNSALDDFDDDDDLQVAESSSTAVEGGDTQRQAVDEKATEMNKNMEQLMNDLQNPEFQKTLEDTLKQLGQGGDMGDLEKMMAPFTAPQQPGGSQTAAEAVAKETTDIDSNVAKTLQALADSSKDLEGMQTAQAEQVGEDIMANMMKEFEKFGENEDFQGVIDNMMKQFLSKEVMYEPMKQISEKFPEWLAENQSKLEPEKYESYGKQYQYFQEIVNVYETEPDNIARLMELMKDMQDCDVQPPAEILKDLAPGLEFDGEGMPVMPNMGPGMMPGFANLPPGADGEKCCIQ